MIAYRSALLEFTRERGPLTWALTLGNFGTAQWALGEREGDTEILEHAVREFRAALMELPHDQDGGRRRAAQDSLERVMALLEQAHVAPNAGVLLAEEGENDQR